MPAAAAVRARGQGRGRRGRIDRRGRGGGIRHGILVAQCKNSKFGTATSGARDIGPRWSRSSSSLVLGSICLRPCYLPDIYLASWSDLSASAFAPGLSMIHSAIWHCHRLALHASPHCRPGSPRFPSELVSYGNTPLASMSHSHHLSSASLSASRPTISPTEDNSWE